MNLNQIYENLKRQYEKDSNLINESQLRQQAWMLRDRMLYEQHFNSGNREICNNFNLKYQWINHLKSDGVVDIRSVKIDKKENIITAGSFLNTLTIDDKNQVVSDNLNDGIVIKYNDKGDLIWYKHFKCTSNLRLFKTEIDRKNNIYIVGHFFGEIDFDVNTKLISQSGAESILIKLDENGNFKWVKSYPSDNNNSESISLTINNKNEIIIVGRYSNDIQFNTNINRTATGTFDGYIVKYNEIGEFLWVREIKGFDISKKSTTFVFPTDCVINKNNQIIVVGHYKESIIVQGNIFISEGPSSTNSGLGRNSFILILNDDGSLSSFKNITSDNNLSIETVSIDNKNRILVGGNFSGTFKDNISSVQNSLLVKYDNNLNFLWYKTFKSNQQNWIRSVKVDSCCNIYCSGFFTEECQFDDNLILNYQGQNSFLIIFNEDSVLLRSHSNSVSNQGYEVSVNRNKVLQIGFFEGTTIFGIEGNSSEGNATLTSQGSRDVYLISYLKQLDI